MTGIRITAVAYHRNGVAGNGFHVVLFALRDGKTHRRMQAIRFENIADTAVTDLNESLLGNVAFANGNSWRGDDFAADIDAAIAAYRQEAVAS